jgi:hypothetical protein
MKMSDEREKLGKYFHFQKRPHIDNHYKPAKKSSLHLELGPPNEPLLPTLLALSRVT